MRLIDIEPLYKQYCELEKQARECQLDYLDHCKADNPKVIKWSAILTERTAYKYDLLDAPKVDAVPVVRCKDCKFFERLTSEMTFCIRGSTEEEPEAMVMTENDYCSKGERRGNNDTNTD